MHVQAEVCHLEPPAEARAYFLIRRPDGELNFMHATEIFTGTLADVLSYLWRLPVETRRCAYVECGAQAIDPDMIERLRLEQTIGAIHPIASSAAHGHA